MVLVSKFSNICGHFLEIDIFLRVWKITYLNNCASLCRISSTTLCLWLMVKDYYSHFFSHYYTLWKVKNFSVTQTYLINFGGYREFEALYDSTIFMNNFSKNQSARKNNKFPHCVLLLQTLLLYISSHEVHST